MCDSFVQMRFEIYLVAHMHANNLASPHPQKWFIAVNTVVMDPLPDCCH
jgi:hypothetical protein